MPMTRSKLALLLAGAALVALPAVSGPARAGDGAAFVGGMIGGHVLTRMSDNAQRRTAAEERQADAMERQAANQPTYQAQQPAAAPAETPQSRLDTLDELAAGGYITKEEYDKRRQAILDSM